MTDKLKIYSKKQTNKTNKKQEKYTSIEKLYKKQTKEYYLLINYYINIYNYPHNNNKLTKEYTIYTYLYIKKIKLN